MRFGVAPETAPRDWRALKELSGMSGRMAQGLYREAIARGARPGQWWGTFEPVPRSQWTPLRFTGTEHGCLFPWTLDPAS